MGKRKKEAPCLQVRVLYTPYTPVLYSKIGVFRGMHFFLFLLLNIDCGYSLEPPYWIIWSIHSEDIEQNSNYENDRGKENDRQGKFSIAIFLRGSAVRTRQSMFLFMTINENTW